MRAPLYHYAFGWIAPYAYTALPVLLGTVGGIMLLPARRACVRLNLRRHALHGDPAQAPMDRGFIALLFLTSTTGLALARFPRHRRAGTAAGASTSGAVMALFVTLPYGKFAHAGYRAAALLKWAIEKRRPSSLTLGGE